MSAHHAEATVAADGSVLIPNVPFPSGQAVEVIVQPRAETSVEEADLWKTMAGKPFTYIDPYEPAVPPEDWEVYR